MVEVAAAVMGSATRTATGAAMEAATGAAAAMGSAMEAATGAVAVMVAAAMKAQVALVDAAVWVGGAACPCAGRG